MNYDQASGLASQFPIDDPSKAFELGVSLLRNDFAEILLPSAITAAEKSSDDYRMHQLVGLAARMMGDSQQALASFSAAARLVPQNPLIAHSHARSALEAGRASVTLFDNAVKLAPKDGSVLQGRAAALTQEGQAEAAIGYLADILAENPLWIDGHRSLAQLRGQCGHIPLLSIDKALKQFPTHEGLHQLRVNTLLESRNLSDAEVAIKNGIERLGQKAWLLNIAAHVASESGEHTRADALFAALAPASDINNVALRVRHLIRRAMIEPAGALLDQWIDRDRDNILWPYLSLAWRLLDNPRHAWLEGDKELIGSYDLSRSVADWDRLAEHLRSLHFATAAPLDQSVRGGTQTDGNLLLRDDELIGSLRQTIKETVSRHIAQLPSARTGHPTLIAQRQPQRIAGSWSVRLYGSGYHSDHVHSQGWISSALYVALPDTISTQRDTSGWLSLGECRELAPDLKPLQLIEPTVGKLVLFPSTMWHGTRPFSSGERLTIAFDIARPKQSLNQ